MLQAGNRCRQRGNEEEAKGWLVLWTRQEKFLATVPFRFETFQSTAQSLRDVPVNRTISFKLARQPRIVPLKRSSPPCHLFETCQLTATSV